MKDNYNYILLNEKYINIYIHTYVLYYMLRYICVFNVFTLVCVNVCIFFIYVIHKCYKVGFYVYIYDRTENLTINFLL